MESWWEESYILLKIVKHSMSEWLQDLHTCKMKEYYHLNNLKLFVTWQKHDSKKKGWMKVTEVNERLWRMLISKKKSQSSEQLEKAREAENLIEISDILYWLDGMTYSIDFRDENWNYWRERVINLQKIFKNSEL